MGYTECAVFGNIDDVRSFLFQMYNKDSFYFLELLSVDPDDNGNYRCVITNRLGTAEVSAELEVFCEYYILIIAMLVHLRSRLSYVGHNLLYRYSVHQL